MERYLLVHGDEEPLRAGHVVPAGIYRRIGTDHVIVLELEDYLPASLDGAIALYERIEVKSKVEDAHM